MFLWYLSGVNLRINGLTFMMMIHFCHNFDEVEKSIGDICDNFPMQFWVFNAFKSSKNVPTKPVNEFLQKKSLKIYLLPSNLALLHQKAIDLRYTKRKSSRNYFNWLDAQTKQKIATTLLQSIPSCSGQLKLEIHWHNITQNNFKK